MTDLLSIGATALSAYRAALNTVGENVANAETPGFSRRRIAMSEVGTGLNGARSSTASVQFNGVRVDSITRNWQERLARDVWASGTALGAATVRQDWLQRIETRMSEDNARIGKSLTAIYTATDRLAASPDSPPLRQQLQSEFDDTAYAFRQVRGGLDNLDQAIGEALGFSVDRANSALTQLASINSALRVADQGSALRASLEDARDVQISALTDEIDAEISFEPSGAARITHGDATLLDDRGARTLRPTRLGDGSRGVAAINSADLVPLYVAGGRIAGHLTADGAVRGQVASLDALAVDVAAYFNNWSASGTTPAGGAGAPIYTGTDAASLSAVLGDPANLALARTGEGANANLNALSSLRGSWALEDRWTQISATSARASAAASDNHAAADTLHQANVSLLDTVTGVDLDAEAADLLRLQLAYNAAARIVQVAQETISEIMRTI